MFQDSVNFFEAYYQTELVIINQRSIGHNRDHFSVFCFCGRI